MTDGPPPPAPGYAAPSGHRPAPAADVVDVAELLGALRRGLRLIAAMTVVGALVAAAVLAFAPRRFEGSATVLLRSKEDAGSSLLSRFGVPAELAPASLGASLKSPMETELQILESDALLGSVGDSLGLQIEVLSPRGTPSWRLLEPRAYGGAFRKRTLTFAREGDGYRVTGGEVSARLPRGGPRVTSAGTFALAAGPLPDRFEVRLYDREDALKRLRERVEIAKAGGEVARVAYAARDSASAAAVPNAIITKYLHRRRTTDRGVNQYRVEFLSGQADSVERQLADAERELRAYQERSGVLDPEVVARIDVEGAAKVREQLAENQVEGAALNQMLRDVEGGSLSARQLAAYPSFLRSPAINEILGQIAKLETERTSLLERRTDADPEVLALSQGVRALEQQLQPLGVAYAGSLARQRAELEGFAGRFASDLAALPEAAQAFARRQRDVLRLSQTSLALQTQLLEARLAAIGEGGDVRQVDTAISPKRAAFPRPTVTLASGVAAGFALGTVLALAAGFFSPRVGSSREAGRLLGVPSADVGGGSPLFVATVRRHGVVAVAPVSERVDVARVVSWLSDADGRSPAPRAVDRSPVTPVGAAAAAVGAEYAHARSNGNGAYRPGASLTSALLPLTSPAAMREVVPGLAVVLVCERGTPRAELAEAAAALRVAGAQVVGVVA